MIAQYKRMKLNASVFLKNFCCSCEVTSRQILKWDHTAHLNASLSASKQKQQPYLDRVDLVKCFSTTINRAVKR